MKQRLARDAHPAVSFDGVRALVIGDTMLDRFCYGTVSRISPEAPVPVMHVTSERAMLGGAGNVLSNLAALECPAVLISLVGDDAAGRQCLHTIEAMGCDASGVVVAPSRPTTVKTRMISGSQQLLRCDEEDASPLSDDVVQEIIARFDAAIADCNIVAISDYAKGVLHDQVLRHVTAACRSRGIPVVVDPKRRDLSVYAGATVIKPNRSELSAFTGSPCASEELVRRAAETVATQTGAAVLVTLSDQGMALLVPGEAMQLFPATATEVFDVSGAGDTALAVFCAAVASGHDLSEAAMLANAGAGVVVRKLGTATISRAELGEELVAIDGATTGTICTREEAVRQVARWRLEGLKVGFTNGCFDIVHAGHVTLLQQARALCDRLVVGLNSDDSVARLKGPSRPIQAETSRAQVLAALDPVDLVVVFEEDTPLELITAIRPTELFKGADYTEDNVVGAREVKADGGRVHLIELVPGLSTTRAVERIKLGAISMPGQNPLPQGTRSAAAEVRI